MGSLLTLLALSIVMAVASFLVGILPLSISLSRSQLRIISTIGMGVLVGTSMIVIIPEGVETLYTASETSTGHSKRMLQPEAVPGIHWAHARSEYSRSNTPGRLGGDLYALPGPVIPTSLDDPPKTPTEPNVVGILENGGDQDEEGEHADEHEEGSPHTWIGLALISGFVLMFLIDKLPQLTSSPKVQRKTHNIALNHIGRRFNLTSSPQQEQEEAEGFIDDAHDPEPTKQGYATTIGLVIHGAADGIALGASSSTSQTKLSLIIFFAIMIHKAPAAFGLTSILLRQGLSKKMVRAHLVLFSLAAPTGALLTWMAARMLGSRAAHNASNTKWWTGVLLLFSAGTFLYVAMHSMQEVLGGSHHEKHDTNGQATGSLDRGDSFEQQQEEHKTSLQDLAAALFGMVLPLFLQIKHSH